MHRTRAIVSRPQVVRFDSFEVCRITRFLFTSDPDVSGLSHDVTRWIETKTRGSLLIPTADTFAIFASLEQKIAASTGNVTADDHFWENQEMIIKPELEEAATTRGLSDPPQVEVFHFVSSLLLASFNVWRHGTRLPASPRRPPRPLRRLHL